MIDGGTRSHTIRMLHTLQRMLDLPRLPPRTVLQPANSVPGPRSVVLPPAFATQALGDPTAILSAPGSTALLPHATDLPLPAICLQRF